MIENLDLRLNETNVLVTNQIGKSHKIYAILDKIFDL